MNDHDYENDDERYFGSDDDDWDDEDDSMDGDHESALSSAGFGTDENYGDYGDSGIDDFRGYGDDADQPDDWHLDDGDF
jgi:hypothetical protein